MRIVYFIDHLRHDGTQRVLKQLVEGLSARGHEQAIVCLDASRDEALVQALRKARADVRIVGRLPLITGYGIVSTWRWLRRERFDVAVTLLFVSDVVGRMMVRAAKVPRVVSSIRARNTHYPRWKRFAVRQTMRWADTVVINSASVRDFAIAEEGAPPNRTFFIPNGVQVEAYRRPMSGTDLRDEFGLSPERWVVGSVGRLTHQKGFDLLLQALALMPRDDVDLVLVGRGEEEARLRARAAVLGLQQRVHFAGYRHDVPHLLGALDLYVHPARFEGMPNALLEAMAAACPIVATAVDGNRELIEDGIDGWLVPAEDASVLATAIQTVLNNPAEARRRGIAAQQRAATQFSTVAMVKAWEDILIGNNPHSRYPTRHQEFRQGLN